jgi:hypothetical protein
MLNKRHKLRGADRSSIPNPSDLHPCLQDLSTDQKHRVQLGSSTESLVALPRQSERADSPLHSATSPLSPVLCAPPWTALVRPLRHMTRRTQDSTGRITPASFFSDSIKATQTKTLSKYSSNQSQGPTVAGATGSSHIPVDCCCLLLFRHALVRVPVSSRRTAHKITEHAQCPFLFGMPRIEPR